MAIEDLASILYELVNKRTPTPQIINKLMDYSVGTTIGQGEVNRMTSLIDKYKDSRTELESIAKELQGILIAPTSFNLDYFKWPKFGD